MSDWHERMRNNTIVKIEKIPLKLKVWQADFAGKQFWNDRDPKCENEEDVRDSDVVTVARELIRLSSDLIHVESDRENNGSQAEQNHWRSRSLN